MKIIKRNGQEAQFDKTKISSAISKANKEVSGSDKLDKDSINTIADSIEKYASSCGRSLNVEEIQDMVEDHIMDLGKYNLARRYITYRYRRSIARKSNTTDDQILSLIDCNNEEIKQENSNKNPTVASVQRDYMAGEVSKDISRRILLPEDVVHAHDEGIIHFHDMDYYSQHMHNCFHEKTKFYTSEGVRSFRDFSEGDSVRVIDKDGQFRDATVHSYGNQLMQKVVFKSCRRRKEVICTRDHRWILHDGTVTTSLQVGDRLACLKDIAADCHPDTIRECKMFALGFLIGDGCDSYNSHDTSCGYSEITLCNKKIQYYDILRKAGYNSGYTTKAGYVVVSIRGAMKQSFLNSFGWRYLSEEDKKWIFLGLFAADGSYNISYDIDSSDERICQMIREISYFAGYYISSEHTRVESTNYKKDAKSTRFTLVTHQTSNHCWKVESISKTGRYKSWCIVEPVTHSFMLEGGMITGNCDLINLEDMLQNGTVISGTMIEKPHSFSTACNVATQIIAQVASCQYGGQSITLSHLAPFVDVSRNKIRSEVESEILPLKDELADRFSEVVSNITEKRVRAEIKRGVQTIQYQVVTLMTTNGQAPFITVFMYIDEVPEGRTREDLCLIIEEVLRQRIQGVKNEKGVWITPAFPKLIYCLDEDNVYPDSKYYYLTELAAKCTAKRMVPDYISAKKMKELKGDVYTCMGCRSFLTPDRFTDNGVGNIADAKNYTPGKHKYYGRFNQGVVTINLVDVGLTAVNNLVSKGVTNVDEAQHKNDTLDEFWSVLDERLELCHKALRCRHERLKGTLSDTCPILWQHGALARLNKGETIDRLLYDGYSTISLGYAGLWECVYALIGKKLTEYEGKELGLEIMRKLNEYTAKWKKAENIDYSLYGTPIESTTYRFAKCLQRRFGKVKGVTDKNYITNSYHVHVTEPIDAFSKLKLESEFQALSPGGAISYVEVPNMQNNIPAVLTVMTFIYDNIIYAELNTKSDYCQVCGYDGEIQIVESDGKLVWECPNCGNRDQTKMNVARRTCGYIGSQFWNQGRTQEIKERVLHL